MHIVVSVAEQRLWLKESDDCVAEWPISTAVRGVGEEKGSYCTPRGRHIIRAKIGAGAPVGTVFVGRRPTGEIYTPEHDMQNPERDWILTRILWLSGCEPGVNRLGSVDTMQRYVYIHGIPDNRVLQPPRSKGCINMRNQDVVELFDRVPVLTAVIILEG